MKKTVVVLALVLLSVAAFGRPPQGSEGKYVLFPNFEPPTYGDSSHHFDVRFYRVDIMLPMTSSAFQGHVQLDLTPRHAGFDTFSLNMVDLVCDSVRRQGNACGFTTPTNRLAIDLDRSFADGESLSVDIYYHKTAAAPQQGFYWYTAGSTGFHVLAYTTTEPQDSRYWLPCFDEPWDKAERGCAINVTVPETLSVASNGLLDSVTTGGGTKTYWWRNQYPISTYLMTLAASKWASSRQWFHLSPTESTYIQNFYWPEDSMAGVSAFAHNVDMMDYFSDSLRYGRYPFEKYGMVEAYPFAWGGMENQTLTMIHHWWIEWGDDNGIAHEMAHQWWGDMVTCQDWRNIWLNEGFGTYSDELYEYHQNGRPSFLAMIADRANAYFDEEASDPRPIYDPPIYNLFTWGHTYCKAAWVQHMLRYLEADTVWAEPGIFFRAMRAYGDSFKYGNANTDDYRRIHEQVTGLELGWFFDEWVYQMGYPEYEVGWFGRETADGWQVVVDVAQNNDAGFPETFHMPVEVKVTWSGGSGTFRIPVAANPQRAVFDVPSQPTALTFDPDNWVLDQHTVTNGVADNGPAPLRTGLSLAGSNPGRGPMRLVYTLAREAPVRLEVADQSGRVVRTLVNATQQSGRYSVTWDGSDAPAGVYFCRFEAGEYRTTRKAVVSR